MKDLCQIKYIGGHFPNDILDNNELAEINNITTNDIIKRTGIETRHIVRKPGTGVSGLCIEACKEMLSHYNITLDGVDCVICCTLTPDSVAPSCASKIIEYFELKNCYGFDLNAACAGFVYGLNVAKALIENGQANKIVLFGGDIMSYIVDKTDVATSLLFGDGAGCVMLEKNDTDNNSGIVSIACENSTYGNQDIRVPGNGSLMMVHENTFKNKEYCIKQEGMSVFRNATTHISNTITSTLSDNNLVAEDIDYFVIHQANQRILHHIVSKLNLPKNKILCNISNRGNTSNGTIPLLLYDFRHLIKKGDKIIIAAFGSGFSWGSAYIII